MMNREMVGACSDELWQAECNRMPIETFSSRHAAISIDDAYAIAEQTLAKRGANRVGYKLGYTSAAMREQMNIAEPNYGVLTDDHLITNDDGSTSNLVAINELIHPLVEPEIALLVGDDISGTGHTWLTVLSRVEAAIPALEIVDTRYKEYTFTLADNIADNSSSARVVLGEPVSMAKVNQLSSCGVVLWSKGRMLDFGVGSNAMGNPLAALAWLANLMGVKGRTIPKGSLIMTGALTKAKSAKSGDTFVADFSQIGSVKVHFENVVKSTKGSS
jgi:2-keto-4-pentenoate hydratase